MRDLAERTVTKLRVRGRGSKHIEEYGKEAPVHLTLAVSANASNSTGFLEAVQTMVDKLETFKPSFRNFCKSKGFKKARADEPLWKFGAMDAQAAALLTTQGLLSGPDATMFGRRREKPEDETPGVPLWPGLVCIDQTNPMYVCKFGQAYLAVAGQRLP